MASITFDNSLAKPILSSSIVTSYPITLNSTLFIPTFTMIMNDWTLNQSLSLPTLVFITGVGNSYYGNFSLPKISFSLAVESGKSFTLTKNLKKPSLNAQLLSEIQSYLQVTLSKPIVIGSLIADQNYEISIGPAGSGGTTVLGLPKVAFELNNPDSLYSTNKTYVLNTFNTAHSTYTNFAFNSYFKFKNEYYAVSSTGVHKLTGDLDDTTAISSEVAVPVSSFDKQGMKACSDIYALGRLVGNLEIITIVDEQKATTGFMVQNDGRQGLHRIRAKISKGIKGSVWQFKIKNVSGSDFQLNNLEAVLRELQRIR
jgi:hypothetical protein